MPQAPHERSPGAGSIILFDGVCNLCGASVRFVLERDPGKCFRFASLQSARGRELLAKHQLDPNALSTLVLIDHEQAFTRSTAALRIARKLRWPWSWMGALALALVPRALRDRVYDFIASNRYRWFGKQEFCSLPTPENRDRFLDSDLS